MQATTLRLRPAACTAAEGERRSDDVVVRAVQDAARGAARGPRPHRHQARLRARRVRRLRGAGRRRAAALLPGRWRSSARAARSRPSKAWRAAPSCIRCRRRFADLGAAQCGYCTPGMLLTAKALLEREAEADARARSTRRSRASSAAAPATSRSSRRSKTRRREATGRGQMREASNVIGKPRRRVDGRAKVTGQTRFADDLVAAAHAAHEAAALAACRTRASNRRRRRARRRRFPASSWCSPAATSRSRSASCRSRRTSTRSCTERVRFVGDPVAAVVADRRADRVRGARPDRGALRAARHHRRLRRGARQPRAAHPRLRRAAATSTRCWRSTSATSTTRSPTADHVFEDLFFFQGNTHLPIEQHATLACARSATAS